MGILVPGSYLAAVLILVVASVLQLAGEDLRPWIQSLAKDSSVLSASAVISGFLFVAYFFGILVRIFSPTYVDKLSTFYLYRLKRYGETLVAYIVGVLVRIFIPRYARRVRKCCRAHIDAFKADWITDIFPYGKTITSSLEKCGMGRVPQLMKRLNPLNSEGYNRNFINYCKWFIDANDPALSRQVQEAEAHVRFIAGTDLVLLISALLSAIFLPLFIYHWAVLFIIAYSSLLLVAILGLWITLESFKHARRREVIAVWSSVYLIVNGATAATITTDRTKSLEAAFFPGEEDDQKQWCWMI